MDLEGTDLAIVLLIAAGAIMAIAAFFMIMKLLRFAVIAVALAAAAAVAAGWVQVDTLLFAAG